MHIGVVGIFTTTIYTVYNIGWDGKHKKIFICWIVSCSYSFLIFSTCFVEKMSFVRVWRTCVIILTRVESSRVCKSREKERESLCIAYLYFIIIILAIIFSVADLLFYFMVWCMACCICSILCVSTTWARYLNCIVCAQSIHHILDIV